MKSKKKLEQEVKELIDQGLTPVEIHDQLRDEISYSTVHRWVKKFKKESNEEIEVDDSLNEIETDHSESQLEDIETHEDSNDTQRDSDEIQKDSIDTQKELNDKETNDKIVADRKLKRSVLKSFRRCMRGLLENGNDHVWNRDSLKSKLEDLERIQDDIEEALQYDSNIYQDNFIWNVVTDYINKLESILRSITSEGISNSELLSLKEKFEIEFTLEIDDFDEEFYPGVEFIGSLKSFLTEFNTCISESMESDSCRTEINKLDKLSEFVDQFELKDDYKNELEVIQSLKRVMEDHSLAIENSWWGNKKLSLDASMLEKLNQLRSLS